MSAPSDYLGAKLIIIATRNIEVLIGKALVV
jgi:hypothetical protein